MTLITTANRFRKLALLVTALLSATVSSEEVYKAIDNEGKVIFTDAPGINAQQVEIEETNIAEPVPTTSHPQQREVREPKAYTVSITSPRDGQTFPNRLVPFTVESEVVPPLDKGFKLQLKVDNRVHSTGVGGFTLSGLAIGEHSLQIDVINPRGAVVSSSGTIEIFTRQPGVGVGD